VLCGTEAVIASHGRCNISVCSSKKVPHNLPTNKTFALSLIGWKPKEEVGYREWFMGLVELSFP